ncbi:TIGR01244 family sulfur transferase [Pseudogemmobacter sonorensis]|uniref:TIGR01244 family sulfur transferase n=1 Tax=Pseudogemmobacter sonorensis TaxID=2989681 RepID=UPI0036C8FC48
MDIQKLSPQLGICGQVELSDIPEIVRAGYRLLVCNRPDGEERGQPGFAEIAEAAQAAGLTALYLPVAGPSDFARQAPAMAEAMRTASGPVLAYCRSGARSSMLCSAAIAP